jgi:hypothetical protein
VTYDRHLWIVFWPAGFDFISKVLGAAIFISFCYNDKREKFLPLGGFL